MRGAELKSRIARLTDTPPADCIIEPFCAASFIKSVGRFLEENFRDLVEVTVTGAPTGYVNVSLAGFAHFMKLLLKAVYAADEIKLCFICTERQIRIEIDTRDLIFDTGAVLDMATSSGFKALPSDDDACLTIFTAVSRSAETSIYARNDIYVMNALNGLFFAPEYHIWGL